MGRPVPFDVGNDSLAATMKTRIVFHADPCTRCVQIVEICRKCR